MSFCYLICLDWLDLSEDGLGPATTEGKRKVRPARRDVDAYGQPILFAAGSTQEEAEEMQDDEGQVEQVAARDSGLQVGPTVS